MGGLDLSTGIFKAPKHKGFSISKSSVPVPYFVTVTAQLGSPRGTVGTFYAQLFILKNGKLGWNKLNTTLKLEMLLQMNYLLVEMNMVADLRMMVNMTEGETLELFVGHQPYSRKDQHQNMLAPYLQHIRFCIFAP